MLIEKAQSKLPSGPDVRVWRQGEGDLPAWLAEHVVGPVQSNGTFLIGTPLGNQRVHRGHIVVQQSGEVYTCPSSEASVRVAEMRERAIAGSRASNLVGPGKSLTTAIPSNRRGSRAKPAARTRSYPPVRGAPPSIEWVLIGDLKIDGDYQRSIETHTSRRLIASIAAHWDWRLCMPLAVSRREHGRYVIDGQHRLAAAHLRKDVPHLPCCIATYDGPADEAAMFVAANRARRAINRLDDFHAALVAGDEDALEVDRVVRAAGLSVSRKTGSQSWVPGEIAFTSSIQTVMGRHGERVVRDALSAIAKAFEGQVLSNGASVFLGLTKLMINPPAGLDRDRLLRSLNNFDMKGWGSFVQGVKGGDARAVAMKMAILEAYDDVGSTHSIAA